MEIYLVRHTVPAIAKGICYGQSDVDVSACFKEEMSVIKKMLPTLFEDVYTSPLKRCRKLAEELFPLNNVCQYEALMEMNFGEWELKIWNDIPKETITPWMNDFVNVRTPAGESYSDLYSRVIAVFNEIAARSKNCVIITHAGVIRSVLAYITKTPLAQSFDKFKIDYGCVIQIIKNGNSYSFSCRST